jgi:hypothetical protein
MPTIKGVESKIRRVEGFAIAFIQNGRDVHGARDGMPPYPCVKAARGDMTANQWKVARFGQSYPGFDVEVYDGDGRLVTGQTKLTTVRGTYRKSA